MRMLPVALALAMALSAPAWAQQQSQEKSQSSQSQSGQSQQQQAQAQLSPDAHHLIGKKAQDSRGKDIGKIDDVLVGPDGRIQAMVVDHSGGKRAIPWDQVSLQADQITVKMSDQQVSQLPEYKAKTD